MFLLHFRYPSYIIGYCQNLAGKGSTLPDHSLLPNFPPIFFFNTKLPTQVLFLIHIPSPSLTLHRLWSESNRKKLNVSHRHKKNPRFSFSIYLLKYYFLNSSMYFYILVGVLFLRDTCFSLIYLVYRHLPIPNC